MKLRRIRGTTVRSEIRLSEAGAVPNELQYLRVGKFNHPKYGEFEINTSVLSEMIQNFNAKIRGIDICFDYFHNSDQEASGWPKAFELREGGTQLWATEIDWTPTAERKLAEREIRYFSPDFAFKWQDPETGQIFSNVIFGGGLTNRPFVKEMDAIVADETQGDDVMTQVEKLEAKIKELEAANVKLAEEKKLAESNLIEKTVHTKHAPPAAPGAKPPVDPAQAPKVNAVQADDNSNSGEEGDEVAALKAQIADLQAQLAQAQGDGEKALADKKKLEEGMEMAAKEKEFSVLLSEGKAVAAQKKPFLAGDMKEFIKLSQPVNLTARGHGAGGEEGDISFEDKVMKLAEEKVKADSKLSKVDAIKLAHSELRKK